MNGFEKFIHALQSTMPTPTLFGWFHLLWLGIIIIACTLIIVFRKKIATSPKWIRISVLITGIVCILLEIYKQLVFSLDVVDGVAIWGYQWYAFPFQFCSTPMYIMTIAGAIWAEKSKFREFLYSYLATFSIFAGLVVMIYPGNVFISIIGINIQTMIVHGAMLVVGVLILATQSVKIKQFTLLKALAVFGVTLTIALFMNLTWKWAGGLETGETFNMFFISPYYECTLPLLSLIYANVPYIIFLLIYVIGFTLAAYIVILFAMLCKYLNTKIVAHINQQKINKSLTGSTESSDQNVNEESKKE